MPRIAMDEQDSVDIAGWLLNYEGSDGQIAAKDVAAQAVPLKQTGGGCLDVAATPSSQEGARGASPRGSGDVASPAPSATGRCSYASASPPRYDLNAALREALSLFLKKRDEPATPQQFATLTGVGRKLQPERLANSTFTNSAATPCAPRPARCPTMRTPTTL